MKENELKSLIKEVVRECINEGKSSIPKGKLAKLNPNIAKKSGDKKLKVGSLPSPLQKVKEAGLTSETENKDHGYNENDELRLIRGLNLITKKLLDMHGSSSTNNGPDDLSVDEKKSENDKCDPTKDKKDKRDSKMSENHKVQARSYTTSKDGPQIPKNVKNPKVPNT